MENEPNPPHEEAADPAEPSPLDSERRSTPSAVYHAISFGVLAAALAFFPLAARTEALLFASDSPQRIQPLAPERQPVLSRLVWPDGTLAPIHGAAGLGSGVLLTVETLLLGAMLYALLRLLNPTFRLTTGVRWQVGALFRAYVYTGPAIKALLIGVTASIPVGALCGAISTLVPSVTLSRLLCSAVAGAAGWLLFSESGVAGDYDSGSFLWPSDRGTIAGLITRGAVAGAALALSFRDWPFVSLDYLFRAARSFGLIGDAQWRAIAAVYLIEAALFGAACAVLLVALAPERLDISRRLRGVSGWALLVALLAWGAGGQIPVWLASRYDFQDGGEPAELRLARSTHLPLEAPGPFAVMVFGEQSAGSFAVVPQASTGLALLPQTPSSMASLFQKRPNGTALQRPAYVTLQDYAALTLDPDFALQAGLMSLEDGQEPDQAAALAFRFTTCAATPAARRALARYAASPSIIYPDRDSRAFMGDLFARFGEKEQAVAWYRKARLPRTRVPQRLAARTQFSDGVVRGRLLVDGRPAVGVRMGLMPAQAMADRQNMSDRSRAMTVRPAWFRWASAGATTGADGGFEFRCIVAGAYRLVAVAPVTALPLHPPAVKVSGAPGEIRTGADRPVVELGGIDVQLAGAG